MNDLQDLKKKIEEMKSMDKEELLTELQLLDAVRLRLEQELHSLRNEIDRLREPPLIIAVVIKIMDNKAAVMTTTGQAFLVSIREKVKSKELKPGMFVALNYRTYAVMEILPITSEEAKDARAKVFLTELTWKNAEDYTK